MTKLLSILGNVHHPLHGKVAALLSPLSIRLLHPYCMTGPCMRGPLSPRRLDCTRSTIMIIMMMIDDDDDDDHLIIEFNNDGKDDGDGGDDDAMLL